METIYENTSVNTQEEFCQMYVWVLPKWQRIGGVVFCVVGLLSLFMLLVEGGFTYLYYTVALMAGGIYLILMPKIHGKQQFKKRLQIYGGEIPPSTVLFYENHFQATDIDSSYTVEYHRVKRIGLLKDCIALLTEPGGMVFILSRNSFTKGDAARFHMFLQRKCPQCKLPSWQ